MQRTKLRALASFFVWVLVFGLGSFAPTPSWAATPCGAVGQRACCVGERPGSPCDSGAHEVGGCTGVCTCGGFNPGNIANAIGHCEANAPPPPPPTACGGAGQRACCVIERPGSPCNAGLQEVAGCSGNCTCGGVNPFGIPSSSQCTAPIPCGGAGQRACCVIERPGSPCNAGLQEVAGCSGNCTCGGQNPGGLVKSSSQCIPCGGAGQRACCVIERPGNPCNAGLQEVPGCSGNCTCGGPNPGGLVKASSQCTAPIPCGGAGQRACCVIERPGSPCNAGLQEVAGCSGNCTCGGPNPGGLVNSSSQCTAPIPCGGAGQRACCVIERIPSCNQGLMEIPGCSGNCTCGGNKNPGGLVKSSGTCVAGAVTPQQPANNCAAALATLNSAVAAVSAANQTVQLQCSQAGGAQQIAPTTTKQTVGALPAQNVGVPGGLPAQNVGVPGGLPAKSATPVGLQRPVIITK